MKKEQEKQGAVGKKIAPARGRRSSMELCRPLKFFSKKEKRWLRGAGVKSNLERKIKKMDIFFYGDSEYGYGKICFNV